MRDWERLLMAAEKVSDPAARSRLIQQGYRLRVRRKIEECRKCGLCALECNNEYDMMGAYVSPRRAQISGPTPSFLAFVDGDPLEQDVARGSSCSFMEFEVMHELLYIVGFKRDQVAFIPSVCCAGRMGEYDEVSCKENLEWQMGLAGSRVFVLMGGQAVRRVLYPVDMREAHGTWREVQGGNGVSKRYYFIIRHPWEASMEGKEAMDEVKADMVKLGYLLHTAWIEFAQETMPFDKVEVKHQLTYEQICEHVAGMIRHYLMGISPGKRTSEFLKIMGRSVYGGGELAIRAFWDDEFAKMIGVDLEAAKKEMGERGIMEGESWSKWIP